MKGTNKYQDEPFNKWHEKWFGYGRYTSGINHYMTHFTLYMLNFRFINNNFAFFWNRQVDHNPTKHSRIWTIYYRAIVSDRRFQMVYKSGTPNPPRVVELAADWLRYRRDIFLCGNEEHTWNRKVSCTFHIYYAPCAWIYCMFFVYGDISKFSTQNSMAQHCFPHIHVLKYNALSGITFPGFLCTSKGTKGTSKIFIL